MFHKNTLKNLSVQRETLIRPILLHMNTLLDKIGSWAVSDRPIFISLFDSIVPPQVHLENAKISLDRRILTWRVYAIYAATQLSFLFMAKCQCHTLPFPQPK